MKKLYRVKFISGDKLYELFVKHVYQAEMYGFIVLEGFVFGENTIVVVDPSEEKLKNEFEGVTAAHIPMHAILRIDEVEKHGTGKISSLNDSGNVTKFPSPIYTPKGGGESPE